MKIFDGHPCDLILGEPPTLLPGPSKHRQGKAINSSEHQVVVNVLYYFLKEHENGGKLYKANAVVLENIASYWCQYELGPKNSKKKR